MTLIIMLILAGISLSGLIGEKGLFQRTEDASSKYNEAKAREVLETVLLTDGQYEKNTNPKYNQDEFLDELIKKEIPGSDIKGDVAIIGEYAYELDRSVPKIGKGGNNGYLGNPKDLVWPTVTASEPTLSDDNRSATFIVTAIEDKNGINKIEIWINGERIDEFTKTYDNIKTEIQETIKVNRNGVYTVKAYAELTESAKTTVIGIVPVVEFSPNGDTTYKKEHSTIVTVKETGEKVKSLKYKWTNSVNPPAVGDFSDAKNCNNNDTITGKDFTGTYYLWILLEMDTEPRITNICGSEGFNFDNERPIVTLDSTPISETSFTLTATASDTYSDISSYEFCIDGVKVSTKTTEEGKAVHTWSGTEMKEKVECEVCVKDKLGNSTRITIDARTKLYTWEFKTIISRATFETTEVRSDGVIDLNFGRTIRYSPSVPALDNNGHIISSGSVMTLPTSVTDQCRSIASKLRNKYVWYDNGALISGKYLYAKANSADIYATSTTSICDFAIAGYKVTLKTPDVYGPPELKYSTNKETYTESGSNEKEKWIYCGIM